MAGEDIAGTLERYRDLVAFDDAVNVTHPADCSPDSCALKGYMRDGTLAYQEQTGTYPVVDPDTPDWNPRGCSRQCSFTDATYGEERIRQPMRQTGERGSGEWEPLSWEEAYREIAESVVDAAEYNPQSIVGEITPGEGGLTYGSIPFTNLISRLGGVNLDGDALIGDFDTGQYLTFGKFNHGPTDDDWFNAEALLVWHANPAYSRNPSYHFLTEARYNGTEVVTIAPDYSPSAVHADRYVPVKPGTDAALALGMCRVIIDEELVDWAFATEQTDLPLLVRDDTDDFLRAADLDPDRPRRRFFLWDRTDGLVEAPADTLTLGDLDPVLEGTFEIEVDGTPVTVRPVYDRLLDRLDEYDLETVEAITGVNRAVVLSLARTVATKRTTILNSFNQCKVFHGDLIVRSMLLLLGLTGGWGKPGCGGMRCWTLVGEVGSQAETVRPDPMVGSVLEQTASHDLHKEELATEWYKTLSKLSKGAIPPVFWWYRHCGYDEVWDTEPLTDAGIPRLPSEYMEEAVEKDFWSGLDLPAADVDPRVVFFVATNPVRRTRGGTRVMLEELWPRIDTIVTVDYRWSETALYSDIVLPAAFHHEKEQFDSMCDMKVRFWAFAEKAIEPLYDSKTELTMMEDIAREIEAVARERGLETYHVPHGLTLDRLREVIDLEAAGMGSFTELPPGLDRELGVERRWDDLYDRVTRQTESTSLEASFTHEDIDSYNQAIIDSCVSSGLFPEGTDLETVREIGYVKYDGAGESIFGLNTTHTVEPDKTVPLFTQHVREKKVFPSMTGRAQFYIGQEWFVEAGEELPCHKDPPASMGGDRDRYPLYVTSGHNRHSTQGITLASEVQTNQHRGEPHAFISREAANERGIEDGDHVRIFNDYGAFTVQAKVASTPAPDQVVVYHAWDPYLYPDGVGLHHITPGLIKPLHLAGNYGHLEYYVGAWQPQQHDRHTSVDIEPLADGIERTRAK